MKKTKLINENSYVDFEGALNEMLGVLQESWDKKVIDIKFCNTKQDYSALIIYEDGNLKTPTSLFPFGKYQGKPLAEVPLEYLKWLEENKKLIKALIKLGLIQKETKGVIAAEYGYDADLKTRISTQKKETK